MKKPRNKKNIRYATLEQVKAVSPAINKEFDGAFKLLAESEHHDKKKKL